MVTSLAPLASNIDLSGVTGTISYTYDNAAQYIPQIIIAVAVFFFLFIVAIAIISFAGSSKTHKHRKKLVDMYVSGMIRKFAKEDAIDLEEEYRLFIKETKREKLYEKDLDTVVEAELSEKIIAEGEKKLNKKEKETKA